MSRFFKRREQRPSDPTKQPEPSITPSSGSIRSSTPSSLRTAPSYSGSYSGEDAPERSSSFLNKLKDMKARWSDVMHVDDALEQELTDARLHPEIQWAASIRRSNDLCDAEASLVSQRRRRAVGQLRTFLQIPDDEEINELDVPIVAMGGSGGGFRAMLGFLATIEAAKELEIWDLIMYTAGVSGSCWALGSYYTWAEFDVDRALNHFATHSQHHPLSPKAMRETMISPRGPYFLLAPLQQKRLAGLSQTLMDLYGSFVTAYLWLPTKEEAVSIWKDRLPSLHREWFRWSSVAPKISKGEEPLPLLTAIRHERPWKAWKDKEAPFEKENHGDAEHRLAQDAWWQWYEFSPFEFGCDELKYWIPIWAFGRPFDGGRSTKNLPEHSLSSILGVCTSAPAAPMSIYLGTIQRSLPKGWVEGSIDNVSGAIAHLWGAHETKIFEGRHPVHAANEHNPLFHASPSPRPPGIENARRIHMLDSGISNNSPTYVFLHPSRGTDVIINFDASSDVMEEAAPARNQEMGDMKGLTFTKRAHPFPIKYKYPKKTPSDPNGSSPAQESSSSGRAAQSLVRPPSASSLHNTPSTEPSRHAPIDGLPPSTSSPSSSVSAEAYPPSRTNTDIESSYTTIVPSSYSSSSTTTSRPSPSKRKSSSKGEKGPNGAKDKQAFEKAREEDIKRKAKAQAKGWTAESIEEEFSSRYNQIFDGVPTHPPAPLSSDAKTKNNGSDAPPPVEGEQQAGSAPYNVSDHNVPLATRPVSLLYMPLFPHASNPSYDPTADPFSSSYNLKWTQAQVETIRKTAKANFHEGIDVTRLVVREAYERRKKEREGRERAAAASKADGAKAKVGTETRDVEGMPVEEAEAAKAEEFQVEQEEKQPVEEPVLFSSSGSSLSLMLGHPL